MSAHELLKSAAGLGGPLALGNSVPKPAAPAAAAAPTGPKPVSQPAAADARVQAASRVFAPGNAAAARGIQAAQARGTAPAVDRTRGSAALAGLNGGRVTAGGRNYANPGTPPAPAPAPAPAGGGFAETAAGYGGRLGPRGMDFGSFRADQGPGGYRLTHYTDAAQPVIDAKTHQSRPARTIVSGGAGNLARRDLQYASRPMAEADLPPEPGTAGPNSPGSLLAASGRMGMGASPAQAPLGGQEAAAAAGGLTPNLPAPETKITRSMAPMPDPGLNPAAAPKPTLAQQRPTPAVAARPSMTQQRPAPVAAAPPSRDFMLAHGEKRPFRNVPADPLIHASPHISNETPTPFQSFMSRLTGQLGLLPQDVDRGPVPVQAHPVPPGMISRQPFDMPYRPLAVPVSPPAPPNF